MAVPLPRPVQLKLEQTLAQWQRWQTGKPLAAAPRPVRVLGDGHSNHSVLVESGAQYVVRIDGVDPAAHGLNRQGEWRILQAAHRVGVAPRPCYFNPDLGSLVCEHLESRGPARRAPKEVAELLRRIHRLPPCHSRLDLRERILRYERRLAHRRQPLPDALARLRGGVAACLTRSAERARGSALCHHDLLRANRIAGDGCLRAIDWEYSAMGDPLYDVAVVICGDELDTRESEELVRAYLGRTPSREEACALLDYGVIYRYLALLWYLAGDHPALDAAGRARSVERLAASLRRAEAGMAGSLSDS